MKKYDLRKIMKTAHEIYRKYFKLYQLTHGVQTFGDCMKVAWANEKKRIADEEARKAEKEAMQAALIQPERRSTYDCFNAPSFRLLQSKQQRCFRFSLRRRLNINKAAEKVSAIPVIKSREGS